MESSPPSSFSQMRVKYWAWMIKNRGNTVHYMISYTSHKANLQKVPLFVRFTLSRLPGSLGITEIQRDRKFQDILIPVPVIEIALDWSLQRKHKKKEIKIKKKGLKFTNEDNKKGCNPCFTFQNTKIQVRLLCIYPQITLQLMASAWHEAWLKKKKKKIEGTVPTLKIWVYCITTRKYIVLYHLTKAELFFFILAMYGSFLFDSTSFMMHWKFLPTRFNTPSNPT